MGHFPELLELPSGFLLRPEDPACQVAPTMEGTTSSAIACVGGWFDREAPTILDLVNVSRTATVAKALGFVISIRYESKPWEEQGHPHLAVNNQCRFNT